MCPKHLREHYHVHMADSTIPGAGRGVFACGAKEGGVVFLQGDVVVPYAGEHIDYKELHRRYGNATAPYAILVRPNLYEDGACVRGIGSMINHSADHPNVTFMRHRNRIYFMAQRDILHGEELLVHYGSNYAFDDHARHRTI